MAVSEKFKVHAGAKKSPAALMPFSPSIKHDAAVIKIELVQRHLLNLEKTLASGQVFTWTRHPELGIW